MEWSRRSWSGQRGGREGATEIGWSVERHFHWSRSAHMLRSLLAASNVLAYVIHIVQEGVSWLQEEWSWSKVCNKGYEEGWYGEQEYGKPRYLSSIIIIIVIKLLWKLICHSSYTSQNLQWKFSVSAFRSNYLWTLCSCCYLQGIVCLPLAVWFPFTHYHYWEAPKPCRPKRWVLDWRKVSCLLL